MRDELKRRGFACNWDNVQLSELAVLWSLEYQSFDMLLKGLVLLSVSGAQLVAAFRTVTAQEAWDAINPGWNVCRAFKS